MRNEYFQKYQKHKNEERIHKNINSYLVRYLESKLDKYTILFNINLIKYTYYFTITLVKSYNIIIFIIQIKDYNFGFPGFHLNLIILIY